MHIAYVTCIFYGTAYVQCQSIISFIKFSFFFQVVPSVAIGFTVYDSMKDWLSVPSREKAAVVVPVLTEDGNAAPVHSS